MIDEHDPACSEIAARAARLGIGNNPDKPAHALGKVTLADGSVVNAHVVHSADAIITDGTFVVMINRRNEPGKGKPATPGGFMDRVGDRMETVAEAAAREAKEETGVDLSQVANPAPVGKRDFNRPHDVRRAKNNGLQEKYGIAKGDVFMVSALAVRFDLPELAQVTLHAGDDAEAGSARLLRIASLTRENLGIPDHLAMINAALAG